ncbi:hypothetical protein M378DRAFT_155358 [Amanita muscaria Koide BX008]|uniref:S-formylglutathione hydrolase n=1 Tax=Amanita muscaria (strain Koide BX008) TaxID=946122 RepID=A0A0C2XR93_AMAMK|nr:hypothetical protein M378DRAFT_155358 [Amanita muscaria Koide BX008]
MAEFNLKEVASNNAFGGKLVKYKFKSIALGGLDTQFNIYLPPQAQQGKVPLLVYLAGLTCTEDNGAQKGGFLGPAAERGIAILFPDTSPRGAGIEGEDDNWDFGTGAGFYLDATNPKYSKHYNMYTHVTTELPQVIEAASIPIDAKKQSIFGHSMGGHGALTLYLSSKNAQYRSVSAFAPICNPSKCPWGEKAFAGYLQGGVSEGKERYDATELVTRTTGPINVLVDYGTSDSFYKQGQLLPENFVDAARKAGHDESRLIVRGQEGYDHSYYFISTFASDHIQFHAQFLKE